MAGDKMIAVITNVFTVVAGKFLAAVFTERLISKLIIELMRSLVKKTTNTIDDGLVEDVAGNMKL